MASKSRRIPNVNGASVGPLKNVAYADTSAGLVANAVKAAQPKEKDAVKEMLTAVKAFIKDSDKHQLYLDAKVSDILMGRIASLLDEVKSSFAETELQDIKQQIIDELSSTSISSMLGAIVASQISNLFDDDAKKEDLEELKAWIKDNVTSKAETSTEKTTEELPTFEDEASEQEAKPEETEDNEEGDFKDSSIAKNFDTIQKNIYKQFDDLNKNIGKVFGAVGKVTGFISKGLFGAIGGIAAGVGLLSKGIKGIVGGIGKLGSKISGVIASPFKKIGGFFSSLNPFKRKKTDENGEKKKQRIKDLLIEKIANVLEKVWKKIEPFIDIALHFMTTMILSVVVPIAVIAAQVLLVVGALVLIGIGLYMAYKWITAKVKAFWNYITSGKLWEDIKEKFSAFIVMPFKKYVIVPFKKYIWNPIKAVFNRVFSYFKSIIDDFKNGRILKGLWKILKGYILSVLAIAFYPITLALTFIKPLRDKVFQFIELVKSFWKEKVWPMIEPFVTSLTQLKDSIVKAFSAWDTNKSIWENLQNIGSIIKDTIVDWWNNDNPFKPVYEQYIAPFVEDIIAFVKRIRDAFKQWDTSKGIWENLKNIDRIIKDSIKEWWESSSIKKLWDNTIKPKVIALKEKLGNAEMKIPMIGTIRPFGPLIGKPAFEGKIGEVVGKAKDLAKNTGKAMVGGFKKIGSLVGFGKKEVPTAPNVPDVQAKINKTIASASDEKALNALNVQATEANAQQSKDIAQQQVQQAAMPVKELDQMQQKQDQKLSKDGAEVSNMMMQKEEAQEERSNAQSDAIAKMSQQFTAFGSQVLKKLDDQSLVPMPIVLPPDQRNSAMMRDF